MIRTVLLLSLLLFAPVVAIGCGPSPGTQGDTNDPAQTTDEEQMADETGDVE